jgi:hypothetical protein
MQERTIDKKWFNELLHRRGFKSQKAFAAAVRLDGPKLTNLLSGKRRLQMEDLIAMTQVLRTPMANLVQCFAAEHINLGEGLGIFAAVFDDDSVEFHDLLDEKDERTVYVPVRDYHGTGIRVRTQTLSPRYFEGEVLAARISQDQGQTDVSHLLGREVIVQYSDGIFLKILQPGSRRGFYNLTSLNIRLAPVIDADVVWAEPIDFHVPGCFRPKYRS